MPVTYLTLTWDGVLRAHSDPITLDVLQKGVGGLIEAFDLSHLPGEPTLWLNEEGKLTGLEPNWLATLIAGPRLGNDTIVGDVVFTGGPDRQGETKPLTPEQVAHLRDLHKRAAAHLIRHILENAR